MKNSSRSVPSRFAETSNAVPDSVCVDRDNCPKDCEFDPDCHNPETDLLQEQPKKK